MTSSDTTSRLVKISLILLFGGLLTFLLFYLFLDLLLPFTAAFASAVILSPVSRRIGKRTQMSLRTLRLFLLFLLMGLLSFLLIFGTIKLLDEAGAFFSTLYSRLEILLEKVFAYLEKLKDTSANISPTAETLGKAFGNALQNAMSELSAKSASLAAHFAAKLPSLLFSLLIFLLAVFYFSFDYEAITAYLASLFPQKHHTKIKLIKQRLFATANRFFRAYGLLFIITFIELYLSFLFLRIEHAFLLALIASILDILPAVGVGIVLLPWSAALFIGGNTARAIAILVICLAVTLIRQVLEPHIIGKQFGIHPLASLIALYVGLRLMGVLGILLSPFIALAVSELLSFYRQKIRNTEERTPI